MIRFLEKRGLLINFLKFTTILLLTNLCIFSINFHFTKVFKFTADFDESNDFYHSLLWLSKTVKQHQDRDCLKMSLIVSSSFNFMLDNGIYCLENPGQKNS